MSRLNQQVANLYPRWWRERYGAEFAALLSDTRPSLFATLDIVKGAIAMQLSHWTPLRLIALWGVAGLLTGLGTALALAVPYESAGYLRIFYPNSLDRAGLESLVHRELAAPIRGHEPNYGHLLAWINVYKLYPELQGKIPPREIAKRMLDQFRFSWVQPSTGWPLENADMLQMKFSYSDPVKAQQVVEALGTDVTELSRFLGQIHPPDPPGYHWHSADMVGYASLSPTRPFSDRWIMALSGLSAGMLLGAVISCLRHSRRDPQPPPTAESFEPQLA